MKKILFFTAVLIFGLTACSGGGGSRNKGVVINGVRWATHNVDTPGTFTRNSEDFGGDFTWEEAQNACPRGWRLPTQDELQSLINVAGGGWAAVNGVNGRLFGTAPNQIFLPAAGLRDTNGALGTAGGVGYCWSSSASNINNGWNLWFNNGNSNVNATNRALGFSVRCVSE